MYSLHLIRKRNPDGRIVAIIDNFNSHNSSDLNPIQFILKSLKRQISNTFIASEMHLKHILQVLFYRFSSSLSFAKSRIEEFLSVELIECNKLDVMKKDF